MIVRSELVSCEGMMLAGRYALQCLLGTGSFGVVYGALDTSGFQKKVAVKLIQGSSVSERDRKEIQIMAKIIHPNIVELIDVVDSNDPIGIVMELCPSDLFDRIELCGWFGEEETRHYTAMLFAGIEALHNQGVAHRDIKPENLLLDASGVLKISDFGLSSFCSPSDLLVHACGTPQYVPPEALAGQPYSGFSGDLWAAGVVIFMMLNGRFPFAQASPSCEFFKHYIETLQLQLPETCHPSLESLLKGLLTPDFSKRATLPDVLKHPWINRVDESAEICQEIISCTFVEGAKSPGGGEPWQPLVAKWSAEDSALLAARISQEEGEWEAFALEGVMLKRTDFKRARSSHKIHLKLAPATALQLIAQVASSGDLGMIGNISIDAVSLDEKKLTMEIQGGCDDGQLMSSEDIGRFRRMVQIHADALGSMSRDGETISQVTFSRFQGDTLSFHSVLLALKSNVDISLHSIAS